MCRVPRGFASKESEGAGRGGALLSEADRHTKTHTHKHAHTQTHTRTHTHPHTDKHPHTHTQALLIKIPRHITLAAYCTFHCFPFSHLQLCHIYSYGYYLITVWPSINILTLAMSRFICSISKKNGSLTPAWSWIHGRTPKCCHKHQPSAGFRMWYQTLDPCGFHNYKIYSHIFFQSVF